MARGLHDPKPHVAELDGVTILHVDTDKLCLCPAADVDRGPDLVAELDVAGDEVGVEVCQKDVLDRVSAGLGVGKVLINVTLRIDHGGRLGLVVGDHVRRMGQAGQIVLLDFHGMASGSMT